MSNYPPRGPYGAPPGAGNMPPPPSGAGGAYRPPGAAGGGGPSFFNPATGAARPPPTAGANASMPPPPSGAGYGAPPPAGGPPAYGAPPTYNQPPPGPPANAYGPPTGAYGAPPANYGPPGAAPAYGQPAGYGPPTGNTPPPSTGYNQPPPVGGPPAGGIAPPGYQQAPPAPRSVPFFSTGGGVPSPINPSGAVLSPAIPGPPTAGYPGAPGIGPPGIGPPPTGVAGIAPPPIGMPPPPTGNLGPPSVAPPQYSVAFGAGPVPNPASMTGMPMGFDSGSNLAGMQQPGMGGGLTPGGPNNNPANMDPNMMGGAPPLPTLDEVDLSIQCNPNFLRASVTKIVSTQNQANASRLPLGVVCKPMWNDKGTANDEIDVVDFGATGIIRCKRCRTYINPYVTWADNGRRWRCNICGMLNDVPSTYFSHLDNKGHRRDRDQRPELCKASVEFVAPGDYMVRPPQPPVFFFVIDVSEPAYSSGMIQSLVNAIKSSLDELPGSPRTQIGFITFDQHIHFYNLKSSLSAPQMLVVSDIHDVIIPLPDDLLVNLQESRGVVDSFLDSLPAMFKSNATTASCTGPALMAAKRVIQHVGGKILLFQSTLPSLGEGALKMRENPRLLGTDKEHTLLNAEDAWYKTNSIDFSRLQVAVDTFLFSAQYTDLATIAVLSKYTGGSTYYYPGFFGPRDGQKFEKELHHDLTRSTAFEAVMRVRATRGLRFSNFYGNYFIRGSDLLALPNCTSDSTFALDLAYDEPNLQAQVITVQAALLYTNSSGDRRIRVHTMLIPVTTSLSEMVESLDIDCAMNLLSKQAVDIAQKTGMENARQRVHQTTVEILRAAKQASAHPMGGMPGQYGMPPPGQQPGGQPAQIPPSLLLLPLYSMSLQKSLVLRGGSDVRVDERAFFQQLLFNMDIEESKVFIYPRMFSIHDMGNDIGLPSDNADDDVPTAGPLQVRLPAILNLSYERLSSSGIFLLENGHDLFMWIGRAVNPAIVSTLFGVQSLEGVDPSTLSIIGENSDFSSRVNAVILALREERARHLHLHFIREGDGYAEAYFARYLIEDRANFSGGGMSYTEYHTHVTRAVG